MRSGEAFTQLVEFSHGFPDGDITWTLRNSSGTIVASGTVTPVAGAVSAVVAINGTHNTLAGSNLYESRELRSIYTVSGIQHVHTEQYGVEAFLNFGVTERGVRDKIGLDEDELPNDAIKLALAYSVFETTVGAANLAAVTSAYGQMIVCDAIEALAAIRILPSLRVRVSSREVSGISQFQRHAINWDALAAHLNELLAAGYTLANPEVDPAAAFGSTFLVVTRTDPITGV